MSKPSKQHKYISNPFSVIFRGFNDLFTYNQTMAIIILIFSIIGFFGNVGSPDLGGMGSAGSESGPSKEAITIISLIIGGILIILLPLIIFVVTMYKGLVAYTALETSKHKTIHFGDAFKVVLSKFWTILGISIIVTLKIIGGTLLFIVPGIRASLRYRMVYMHIFDEGSGISQSIKKSKHLTKDHLLEMFGMTTAAAIIPFVGGVMEVGGYSVMYQQLKTLKSSNAPKPPVHWLNYLGFILILALLLLVTLVVFVVTRLV